MLIIPYSAGDIVTLKTGGPEMVIGGVKSELAFCFYYSSGCEQYLQLDCPVEALRMVRPAPPLVPTERTTAKLAAIEESMADEARKALMLRMADKADEFIPPAEPSQPAGHDN